MSTALLIVVSALGLSVGAAAAATSSVADPSVSGPVTGGSGDIQPPNVASLDLDQVGYQQSEYFLSGTATAYAPGPEPLPSDGKWTVAPASTAPYTTRVVVYPAEAGREVQRHGRRRVAQRVGPGRRQPRLDA